MYMEGNYKKLAFTLLQREIYKETNLPTHIEGMVQACPPAQMKGSFFVISLCRCKRGLPYMPASWGGYFGNEMVTR